MTLITSYRKHVLREFSAIFRFSLRKLRGMLFLYGFLQTILLPLLLLLNIESARNSPLSHTVPSSAFYDALRVLFGVTAVPLMLIFSVVFVLQLFRYLHGKRSVDFFHALPVGRTPMLLGKYCAGLFSLLVPFLCNVLLCTLIGILYRVFNCAILLWLLSETLWFLLMTISCFTFAMLIAVCSGTTMEMMLSGIFISVSWPLAVLLLLVLAECLLPGYASSYNIAAIMAFSPPAAAFVPFAASMIGDSYTGLVPVSFTVWWIVLPILMLAAAIAVYRRRKSESAENTISMPAIKIFIRMITTFAAGLGFGFLLYMFFSDEKAFFIGVLAGSVAAHVVAEALYSRGFKGMLKSFRWYAVPAVFLVLFYCSLATGFFGYDTKIPKADELVSTQIELPQLYPVSTDENSESFVSYSYHQGDFCDENGRILASVLPTAEDSDTFDKILDLHQLAIQNIRSTRYPYQFQFQNSSLFGSNETVKFRYRLKNGSTFSRTFSVPWNGTFYEEFCKKSQALSASETFLKQSNLAYYLEPAFIESIDLSGIWSSQTLKPNDAVKAELLEALVADSGKFGYYVYAEDSETATKTEGIPEISVSLNLKSSFIPSQGSVLSHLLGDHSGPVVYKGSGSDFPINPACTHTLAFFEKEGWDLSALNEAPEYGLDE